MAVGDTGPSTSYSDPIYDRLDTVAQRVAKRWPLLLLALLLIIGIALVLRHIAASDPETTSAFAYLDALDESDEVKRTERLTAVAHEDDHTDFFRARAHLDLVQHHLLAPDLAGAREHADAAMALARTSEDPGIEFEARLAQAAVAEDAGELDVALTAYQDVESGTAGTFPAQRMAATLGAARVLQKAGDLDGALAKLEPLIANTDRDARQLVQYGRWLYWQIKRQQANAPDALVTAPPAGAAADGAAAPAATDAAAPAEPAATQPTPDAAAPAETPKE
ncbi:MAG TPA: hypothetical protein VEL07_19900 [Planctomycetota bacterium]|nr:hypothetical protein [Planctomycetota bacterium]